MGKLKVVVPAVKHADGTISKAPNDRYSHAEIIKETGKKGEHGFILSDGSFAGREKAAKVAKAAEMPYSPKDCSPCRLPPLSKQMPTIPFRMIMTDAKTASRARPLVISST